MMIANILDGRPADNDSMKTTLIVTTAGLVSQWMSEIEKHCEPKIMGEVVRYHAGARISSLDTVETLSRANIMLVVLMAEDYPIVRTDTHSSCTTYSEISKSYPKYEPPEEVVTKEKVSRVLYRIDEAI